MSIYWRINPDLGSVDMPQTLMRPFWHPVCTSLDDKQFCLTLPHEKPVIRASLFLFVSLLLLAVSSYALITLNQLNQLELLLAQPLANSYTQASLLILATPPLLYVFYRAQQARRLCFDRQNHLISYPQKGLFAHYHEYSYDDFQGRIEHLKSLLGKRKSRLVLVNNHNQHVICLVETLDNPQSLAGYWSFIVQYMKPDAPLPDVPALHDYPNTTPGVIHQKATDYS